MTMPADTPYAPDPPEASDAWTVERDLQRALYVYRNRAGGTLRIHDAAILELPGWGLEREFRRALTEGAALTGDLEISFDTALGLLVVSATIAPVIVAPQS